MRVGMSVALVCAVANLHARLLLLARRKLSALVGGDEFGADFLRDAERALAGGGRVHRAPLCLADDGHGHLVTGCDKVRGWTSSKKPSAIWSSAKTPPATTVPSSGFASGSYGRCDIATRRPAASSSITILWAGAVTAARLRRQKAQQGRWRCWQRADAVK